MIENSILQYYEIMESISSMSIEELRALLKYYESVEAYEICLNIKDLIKTEERESKLNELGI
jgi:hypothetical protein